MFTQYLANRFQKRFWLEWKINPQNQAYNTPLTFVIEGSLDKIALHNALSVFVNEYEPGCRSFFQEKNSGLFQCVYDQVKVDLEFLVVSASEEPSVSIEEFVDKHKSHIFDLEKFPLFKFKLLQINDEKYLLILNFHHIISDAQSARSFIKYISCLYNFYAFGTIFELDKPDFDKYRQFESNISFDKKIESINYWKNLLFNRNLYVDLHKLNGNLEQDNLGRSFYFTLDKTLSKAFRERVREEKSTLFITISALFSILLAKYTDISCIVLNYPVDSRPPGLKNLFGCFVNNFPLLVEVDQQNSFTEILQQVKNYRKSSKPYQDCTLTEIVQVLRQEVDFRQDHFLNIGLVEAYFDLEPLAFDCLKVMPLKPFAISMEEELTLAYQVADPLVFRINYRKQLFPHEFIVELSENLIYLMSQCLEFPSIPVQSLEWLNPQQKQKIINLGKRHAVDVSQFKTVLDLFYEQVKKFPNQIAVLYREEQLTFGELESKSQRLAHTLVTLLKAQNLLPNSAVIGIFLERNLDLPISILAVIKSGAAYLPLDTACPVSRLEQILSLSQTKIILTQEKISSKIPKTHKHHELLVDRFFDTKSMSSGALTHPPSPQDLAYLLFTSGSTGEPKGVMVQHDSLYKVIEFFQRQLPIRASDLFLGFTAMTFDIFGLELFGALCSGAQLILVDDETRNDAFLLKEFLNKIKPTIIQSTPSLWSLLSAVNWQGNKENLTILCGGEVLPPKIAIYLLSISKKLVQVYGPTETTIWSTWKKMTPEDASHCIGDAIDGTELHVLDQNQSLVPLGVCGELYIGGAGVARGYLNALLNKDRFYFLSLLDSKLRYYRTGDKVVRGYDGQLYYIGRNDFQVKITGHRIEMAEIEQVLLQHPIIKNAVVVCYLEDQNNILAAYLQYDEQLLQKAAIMSYLRNYLPDYMIPRLIIPLNEMPLTTNGKIDRHRLPDPKLVDKQDNLQEPRNIIEMQLQKIWQEVLKIKTIGINDNFFHLGGHSLAAIQLAARIRDEIKKELSVKLIFKHATIAELSEIISHQESSSIKKLDLEMLDNFDLSLAQQRLWFINRYEGTNRYYNINVIVSLNGALNVAALESALNEVVQRHEGLRTVFPKTVLPARQSITRFESFSLKVEEITEQQLNLVLSERLNHLFDLEQGPLYRFSLLKLTDSRFFLVAIFHHIIMDGWSIRLLSQELKQYYQNYLKGTADQSDSDTSQYLDYSRWQLQNLKTGYFAKMSEYWLNQLQDYSELQLPYDYPRPPIFTYRGKHCYFFIDQQLKQEIFRIASQKNLTPFVILLAAYAILLYRYSRQNDFVIGTIMANRAHQSFEKIIGLLANTIPLRIKLNNKVSINDFLREMSQITAEAYTYQEYPFEQIIDLLKVNRDISRNPLVQVLLVFQNFAENHNLELPGIVSNIVDFEDNIAKFDLTLTILEQKEGGMKCCFEYAEELFKEITVQRMGEHFVKILETLTRNQEDSIFQVDMLSQAEKTLLLPATHQVKKISTTIPDLFERSVQKYPSRIALSFNHIHLTYLALNERANQVAHALRHLYFKHYGADLPADTLIGLCLDRSIELIVGILGILKSGAAYVPLDPGYPPERLLFMIEDSKVQLIVTHSILVSSCDYLEPFKDGRMVRLDNFVEWNRFPKTDPSPIGQNQSLAYVIYTSGSTGQPKGVLINHSNVVRLFQSTADLFHFSENDIWTLFHSYAFDFSVWEVWGALFYGGRLVIMPFELTRDPIQFHHFINREKVTVLNQTPSAFFQLIRADQQVGVVLNSLKWVIFGGEKLSIASLELWWQKYPENSPQLVNMYGITETTVHVTFHKLLKNELQMLYRSPIGKPLPDLFIYILDPDNNLAPVGIPGELFIGGAGLARGYLNRPELTRDRFVNQILNGRLYRTGDLVRRLEDGNLEYLGRLDSQVKIRGFRIELGEIESVILDFPGITQAVVNIQSVSGGDRLVAYYSPQNIPEDKIFSFLKQKLPDYMVPSLFMGLDKFPLTANGKIDFKQLSGPHPGLQTVIGEHLPALEKQLISIWSEVLQSGKISADHNFFMVGGDSIRTIQVVEAAERQGIHFTPKELFQNPTIRQLTQHLSQKEANPSKEITGYQCFSLIDEKDKFILPKNLEDAYPLAALQAGMIFHSNLSENSSSYVDIISCRIKGVFDQTNFFQVLDRLVHLHPVLRSSFDFTNYSVPLQLIHSQVSLNCFVVKLENDLAEGALEDYLIKELQEIRKQRFSVEKAPLWRVDIHLLSENIFHFSFTCHHAILDGWSVARLITDIFSYYDASLSGKTFNLRQHRSYYAEFIAREIEIRKDSKQIQFWQNKLRDVPLTLVKESRSSTASSKTKIEQIVLRLNSVQHQMLKRMATQMQSSLENLLLAIHMRALALFCRQCKVVTGIAQHGREAGGGGTEVLGLFLNTIPLLVELDSAMTWKDMLSTLKKEKAGLFDYRHFPLKDIHRLVNHEFFDSLFNFIHFHVFDDLKKLDCLKITPGYHYEETNFCLIAQAAIHPESESLEFKLIIDQNRLNLEKAAFLAQLYQEGIRLLIENVNQTILTSSLVSMDIPPSAWCFNQDERIYQPIYKAFTDQVNKRPENIALSDDHNCFTYRDLNTRANQLAHRLRSCYQQFYHQSLNADTLIGCYLENRIAAVIAMLAILKAGAAYVPLDPAYPAERLHQIMMDSQLQWLLTETRLTNQTIVHEWDSQRTLFVDEIFEGERSEDPDIVNCESDLAYVMYTSGSTGKPKGVMVEHRSVMRLVYRPNYIELSPQDKIAFASSFSFDAATFEVWGALLNGAELVCCPNRILLDGKLLGDFLSQAGITILWLTARLFDRLVMNGYAAIFKNLSYLLVGGDALNINRVQQVLTCPQGRPRFILNGYGPTENTTFTTTFNIAGPLTGGSVPLGQPISGTSVFVIDEGKIAPVGCIGELYIGGVGLTRGYFHSEELNQQCFVTAPPELIKQYHLDDHYRLYKSGDLVRWLASGHLEFIGRVDRQVKIRGFRVELEEVETALNNLGEIKQGVVLLKEIRGIKKLVAYCVKENPDLTEESLQVKLQKLLPQYAIPSFIYFLDTLPLTNNGKVAYDQLPDLAFNTTAAEDVADLSDIERRIMIIWNSELPIKTSNPNINFFDMGGDSLMAMSLHNELQKQFSKKISIIDIFRYPTIRALALFLQSDLSTSSLEVQPTLIPEKSKAVKEQIKRIKKRRQLAEEISE